MAKLAVQFRSRIDPIKDRENLLREVFRASKFIEHQLARGLDPYDVMTQMEQSYGWRVYREIALSLQRVLSRKKPKNAKKKATSSLSIRRRAN